MNHWRNETLSKIFFFLIAGLRLIRLKDKGKLIKYVDIWSLFLSPLSKFWNAGLWLAFPLRGSPRKRESRWERADGLAVWVSEWPLSISSFSRSCSGPRSSRRHRESPLQWGTSNSVPNWRGSFHKLNSKTLGFADSACTAHLLLTCFLSTWVPAVCPSFPPLPPVLSYHLGGWGFRKKKRGRKTGGMWGQNRHRWFSFQPCSSSYATSH